MSHKINYISFLFLKIYIFSYLSELLLKKELNNAIFATIKLIFKVKYVECCNISKSSVNIQIHIVSKHKVFVHYDNNWRILSNKPFSKLFAQFSRNLRVITQFPPLLILLKASSPNGKYNTKIYNIFISSN